MTPFWGLSETDQLGRGIGNEEGGGEARISAARVLRRSIDKATMKLLDGLIETTRRWGDSAARAPEGGGKGGSENSKLGEGLRNLASLGWEQIEGATGVI